MRMRCVSFSAQTSTHARDIPPLTLATRGAMVQRSHGKLRLCVTQEGIMGREIRQSVFSICLSASFQRLSRIEETLSEIRSSVHRTFRS